MGAFDHLEGTYDGAFEQLFGLGSGEFEQKFFKNSNARGGCLSFDLTGTLHARFTTLVICMLRNSAYVLSKLILKLSQVFYM